MSPTHVCPACDQGSASSGTCGWTAVHSVKAQPAPQLTPDPTATCPTSSLHPQSRTPHTHAHFLSSGSLSILSEQPFAPTAH